MKQESTDVELIRLALGSDSAAFATLFDRHAKAVYLFAWGITRNNIDAEDVAQDVFVTAWRKLSSVRIVDASLLPWLLVTTRNQARNHLRREAYRASLALDESIGLPASHAESVEELRWVMVEIEKLDSIDRRICEFCLINGMSYRAAAAQLGIASTAVAKRVERLRVRLRASVRGEL